MVRGGRGSVRTELTLKTRSPLIKVKGGIGSDGEFVDF